MKLFLSALCLGFSLTAFAQNVTKELKDIETEEQAEAYVDGKKKKHYQIMRFNEENHQSKLAQDLLSGGQGTTTSTRTQFEKTYFKVVGKTNDPHYRLSYIYLDGKKHSMKEIDLIRKKVLLKHDSQLETFANLAKKYSDAKNAFKGGDTNWVKITDLPTTLADLDEILGHKVDDIYMVSNKETNQFYIVKKTHVIRRIKEVKVLKVVEQL
ncbi:peptidylprolyl isomerase [Aurantibacter sp.]|uniref:peptidylprolyl isomerase n=1 Tax=Aurantibacter sp. TaxID=2807103 RepID=UPI0035C8106B